MKEPRRLMEDHPSDLARDLLLAGRDERPRASSRQRTIAALGIAGAAVTLAAPAHGAAAGALAGAAGASVASKTSTPLAFGVLAKWFGASALGGAVVATAGLSAREAMVTDPPAVVAPAATVPSAPIATAAARAVVPPPATVELGAEADPPLAPTTTSLEPSEAPAAAPAPPPPLAAEVAALDRARRLAQTGDADDALGELDRYHDRFGDPRLAPEALYLRMDALLRRGDRPAAERVARQLVTHHPASPHTARARALLEKKE